MPQQRKVRVRGSSRDDRVIAFQIDLDDRRQDPTDPMSERNRVTDTPDDPGAVAPTDVESEDGPVVSKGARADAVSVEVENADLEKDDGPVRRPLIRATLKHPEGSPPPPREAPVFTMHEQPRGGPSSGRGPNRSGRPTRDSGQPTNKKNARERQHAWKGNGAGGKKRSNRPDRGGQAGSGQSRRDKGRSR